MRSDWTSCVAVHRGCVCKWCQLPPAQLPIITVQVQLWPPRISRSATTQTLCAMHQGHTAVVTCGVIAAGPYFPLHTLAGGSGRISSLRPQDCAQTMMHNVWACGMESHVCVLRCRSSTGAALPTAALHTWRRPHRCCSCLRRFGHVSCSGCSPTSGTECPHALRAAGELADVTSQHAAGHWPHHHASL